MTLPDGPVLYVAVGVMLTIQAIDIIIRWYVAIFKVPKPLVNHVECGLLAAEVHRIIERMERDTTSRVKVHEQIDDLFKWHAPNEFGQQTWKTQHMEFERLRDKIDVLSDESKQYFRDVFKLLREKKQEVKI